MTNLCHAAAAPALSTPRSARPPDRPLHTVGSAHPRLSAEDIRLISLYAEGLPIEAIARRLELSERTIRRRTRALCDRLGARAAIQVVAWAARSGLV